MKGKKEYKVNNINQGTKEQKDKTDIKLKMGNTQEKYFVS